MSHLFPTNLLSGVEMNLGYSVDECNMVVDNQHFRRNQDVFGTFLKMCKKYKSCLKSTNRGRHGWCSGRGRSRGYSVCTPTGAEFGSLDAWQPWPLFCSKPPRGETEAGPRSIHLPMLGNLGYLLVTFNYVANVSVASVYPQGQGRHCILAMRRYRRVVPEHNAENCTRGGRFSCDCDCDGT